MLMTMQEQKEQERIVSLLASFGRPAEPVESTFGAHVLSSGAQVSVYEPEDLGLDRDSDYEAVQLLCATVCLEEEALAIRTGGTVVRLLDGSGWHHASSWDDLIGRAHHAIVDGVVVKDGSFRMDELMPIVSRATLLRRNMASTVWTEKILLPIVFDLYRAHVDVHGWFYPPVEESLREVLFLLRNVRKDVLKEDNVLSSGRDALPGSTWLKAFSRSYWNVDKGPVNMFKDDRAFERVLRYRLGLNNSKLYTYKLDGEVVHTKETFEINLKNVRKGFIVQRAAVSWFKPAHALTIYRHFLGDKIAPVVFDPSVGFSARLLGFAAAYPHGTYVGVDPASMMQRDAACLVEMLKNSGNSTIVDLNTCGSETYVPKERSIDLVFTSPPYFDTEKYVDEPGQCWRDHPTLSKWTLDYLEPTLRNACHGLKDDGIVAINISSSLVDALVESARKVGLERTPERDLSIELRADHFSRKAGTHASRKEPIVTFKKSA